MRTARTLFLSVLAVVLLTAASPAYGSGGAGSVPFPSEGLKHLHIRCDNTYESLDTGEDRWDWCSYDQLTLDEEEAAAFPMLNASLNAYSDQVKQTVTGDGKDIAAAVEEFSPEEALYSEAKLAVMRADSRVVSILQTGSGYMGGAHPDMWYITETISSESGTRLELEDVLNDPASLPGILAEEILKQIDRDMLIVPDVEAAIRDEMDPSDGSAGLSFTLSYDGITFWLSPYEFTAYAAGAYTIKLPFDVYPNLVKGEYQEVPDNYFITAAEKETVLLPRGKAYFTWYLGDGDEYDDRDLHLVSAGSASADPAKGRPDLISGGAFADTTFRIMSFQQDTRIMYLDGKTFFVLEALLENDYRDLHLYDITDPEKPVELPVIPRHFDRGVPNDPEKVYLSHKVDILSSYSAGRDFRFQPDGKAAPLSDWDDITCYGDPLVLTVKRVIYLPEVDESTLQKKDEIMVPAGAKLSFVRTDSVNTVDMRMEDGTVVRITQEGDGWPHSVNGIELEDLFDGMMFAG